MESLDDILVSSDVKDVMIEYGEKEYRFKLKNLSWSDKNRMISRSVIYQGKSVTVDLDTYYRLALQDMIVEAPWPVTQTPVYLKKLNNFGDKLQKFVPSPFGDEEEEGQIPKN